MCLCTCAKLVRGTAPPPWRPLPAIAVIAALRGQAPPARARARRGAMALTSGVTRTSTLLLTCPPHGKLCFEASLAGRTVRFLWSSRWRGASTLHTVPKAQFNERVLKARSPPFGAPEVLCPQQLYSASSEPILYTRLHCCLVRRTRTIGEALRSSSCALQCLV